MYPTTNNTTAVQRWVNWVVVLLQAMIVGDGGQSLWGLGLSDPRWGHAHRRCEQPGAVCGGGQCHLPGGAPHSTLQVTRAKGHTHHVKSLQFLVSLEFPPHVVKSSACYVLFSTALAPEQTKLFCLVLLVHEFFIFLSDKRSRTFTLRTRSMSGLSGSSCKQSR